MLVITSIFFGINCVTQSQHYAGVAFDIGQTLSSRERNRLREAASSFGLCNYAESASLKKHGFTLIKDLENLHVYFQDIH